MNANKGTQKQLRTLRPDDLWKAQSILEARLGVPTLYLMHREISRIGNLMSEALQVFAEDVSNRIDELDDEPDEEQVLNLKIELSAGHLLEGFVHYIDHAYCLWSDLHRLLPEARFMVDEGAEERAEKARSQALDKIPEIPHRAYAWGSTTPTPTSVEVAGLFVEAEELERLAAALNRRGINMSPVEYIKMCHRNRPTPKM